MRLWYPVICVLVFFFFPGCGGTAETSMMVTGRLNYLERGDYFPCSQCHDNHYQKANSQKRKLKTEHGNIKLDHGRAKFWCLACHKGEKLDYLTISEGEAISYDDGHKLCGNCHTTELEAFYAGTHSKKVSEGDGKPALLSCTGCHNAHNTGIEPTYPLPATE